jgi:hypothetical protein
MDQNQDKLKFAETDFEQDTVLENLQTADWAKPVSQNITKEAPKDKIN